MIGFDNCCKKNNGHWAMALDLNLVLNIMPKLGRGLINVFSY